MKRALQSRSIKRVQRKTPGGRTVVHFKRAKYGYPTCAGCKAKLHSIARDVRGLSKTQKRSERPFPNLCPKCMRAEIKRRLL